MKNDIHKMIDEFQDESLPTLKKYIAHKSILDVGCGNGLNSYFFHKKLGTEAILFDVEDIRDEDAKSFHFVESSIDKMLFGANAFDVVFVQYVIHHLPLEIDFEKVLRNIGKIGKKVIIVEEIISDKTNVPRARAFDEKINQMIHPSSHNMEIYKYYTDTELKSLFAKTNLQLIEEELLNEGNMENGFLQQKIYVLEQENQAVEALLKTA